jgi:hypothetical protein
MDCPQDHKHGVTCYSKHGCRCAYCRKANSDRMYRMRRTMDFDKDTVFTDRQLEIALEVLERLGGKWPRTA